MAVADIFADLKSLDKILITNGGENSLDKAFFYVSQVEGGLFEGSSIVMTRKKVKMFVYPLEAELAKATENEVVVAKSGNEMRELVVKELKNTEKIGVNLGSVTANMFASIKKAMPKKKFVDVSENISKARMIKSKKEISLLSEAAKISSEIYSSVTSKLKEGMTETEVAALLVYEMMSQGASGPSFDTIVGFGSNSALPHYSPGSKKLKKGDFVLTDYGALYKRYCADTTRTVVFGRATKQQKEMYDLVHEAQAASMNAIKPGVNGKLVNKKAYDIIDATKYKGKLMHGVGHGIGLEVHDHPAFGSADITIKENMAVTVEPGVYIPGFGGVRIEDDVVVTKNGYKRLTKKPSEELLEI